MDGPLPGPPNVSQVRIVAMLASEVGKSCWVRIFFALVLCTAHLRVLQSSCVSHLHRRSSNAKIHLGNDLSAAEEAGL